MRRVWYLRVLYFGDMSEEMDVDAALESIDSFCMKLPYTGVAAENQLLHSKLKALNRMVFSHDYRDRDLLQLILEIHQNYESIADKTPYVDIMKVVRFFQEFTESNLEGRPKVIVDLLEKLRKYAE